jgi:hypothetical protein
MAEACECPPVPEQRAKGIKEEGRSIKGRKAVDRSTRSPKPKKRLYCVSNLSNIRISSLVYRLRYPLFSYVSNYF